MLGRDVAKERVDGWGTYGVQHLLAFGIGQREIAHLLFSFER
jgi:hypothetical protein